MTVLRVQIDNSMIVNVNVVYGSEYTLNADVGDTILELKEKIKIISGIPVQKQRIVYKSKQLDDECKSLREYHMNGDHEKIYLLNGRLDPDFIITVMIMFTESVDLLVKSTTTILEIKHMIQQSQGIAVKRQCIICNGTMLKDCTILETENIRPKARLFLLASEVDDNNV